MQNEKLKINDVLAFLLSAAVLSGCAGQFTAVKYVPLTGQEPARVKRDFAATAPARFELASSIVFNYNFFRIAGLGYTRADVEARTFAVTGLNPAGLKLFDIQGHGDNISGNFAFKAMARGADAVKAIGRDISFIYWDCLPVDAAQVRREKYKMIFSAPFGQGQLVHVLAASPPSLVEKRYYENKRLIWQIFYYNYEDHGGKRYPMAVVLKNYRYRYKLTVRVKEICR